MNAGTLSRRQVARLLDVHVDSVSRLLHDGLAAAVVRWGGHGKTMSFDREQVERWLQSRHCGCLDCRTVREDLAAVGEHLLETHHGFRGCLECGKGCDWKLRQPCAAARRRRPLT